MLDGNRPKNKTDCSLCVLCGTLMQDQFNPVAHFDGCKTSVISDGISYFYRYENVASENWNTLLRGQHMCFIHVVVFGLWHRVVMW